MKKYQIEIEISEHDAKLVLATSLERVLNNAIHIGGIIEKVKDEALAERASTLWQDSEELKPLATKLWSQLRDEIFRQLVKEPAK